MPSVKLSRTYGNNKPTNNCSNICLVALSTGAGFLQDNNINNLPISFFRNKRILLTIEMTFEGHDYRNAHVDIKRSVVLSIRMNFHLFAMTIITLCETSIVNTDVHWPITESERLLIIYEAEICCNYGTLMLTLKFLSDYHMNSFINEPNT